MNILDTMMKGFNEVNGNSLSEEEVTDLKNKFPFLKLDKPERTKLMKPFLKQEYTQEKINWEFIETCYSLPERNYQFTAIEYLVHMSDFLQKEDIGHIEKLLNINPWWDTINELSKIVGILIRRYPELKNTTIINWIGSENIWLRITSILCQKNSGENTDTDLLSLAIQKNAHDDNFFLNQSIGQALSQYSKTNPQWVKEFLSTNVLSNISNREGRKFLE